MKKTFLAICAFMLTGMTMAEEANNTIEISNEDGLRAIDDYIADGTDAQCHFILTSDITLSGDWTPLGTPNSNNDNGSFNGTFDGQGHTIYNLNFKITDQNAIYMGLFGRIGYGGVVKNLNVFNDGNFDGIYANAGEKDGSRNIGTIAGVNHGTILNCTSNVNVYCNTQDVDGGGIAGENGAQGLIKNCIYTGRITPGEYNAIKIGGIVGDNETGGTLQNCYCQATIVGLSSNSSALYGQSHGEVNDCAYHYGDAYTGGVKLEGRTFYKDQNWNTLCLPFDVNIQNSVFSDAIVMELDTNDKDPEGNSYANPTGIAIDDITGLNTLYLNFKPVTDIISKGRPYIFRWTTNDPNGLVNPSFPGAILQDLIEGYEPKGITSTDTNVTFVGTFFSKDIEDKYGDPSIIYLGSGNQTYYPYDRMSINALRAYFKLNNGYKVYVETETPEPGPSNVNAFNLNFNDESTAVLRIEAKEDQSGVVYDLSGRVVESDHLKPGIYIRGGKKFLIRK